MRTPTRWRAALAAVLAVGGLVTVSGADARTAPRAPLAKADITRPAAQPTAARPPAYFGENQPIYKKYGIPAPVVAADKSGDDSNFQLPYQATLSIASATLPKSAATVATGGQPLLAYARTCAANLTIFAFLDPDHPALQSCCPGSMQVNCRGDQEAIVPTTSEDFTGAVNWIRVDGSVWISSPRGAPLPFGYFRPIPVRLLAFGSVPVTATAYLKQPLNARGGVTPLRFDWTELSLGQPVGTRVAGYPLPNPRESYSYDEELTISGKVDVSLADIRVDGQPLNVGPRCRTVAPASLTYRGPKGWYRNDELLPGRPGAFQPIVTAPTGGAGQVDGNLELPAFTGCRDGEASLDRLVTALASAARNPLLIKPSGPLKQCATVDTPGIECVDFPYVPIPEGQAARKSQAVANGDNSSYSNTVPAAGRSGPNISDLLARALRRLSAKDRAAALARMPAALATPTRVALRRLR